MTILIYDLVTLTIDNLVLNPLIYLIYNYFHELFYQ